ncbi:TIGR00730 family Rossman fold protein [Acidiphilium sp. AL]|uniref:Cytokinin riboside 5'-monophosphate phosphoribohydrolase n=1 Tax=Acidiphilium iwatense TaxID=768198 RepID=A0ABS9DTG2_9PROT|nr:MULTISPECIES: TIGR00730 family Rossman fold protein [Acidiphilium]MCF3945070.1 TIGR00730 family Rossman fold protein [Acidiphilium iwatense]MCU4160584.1 TIGR00730 family Rossman fold protein [Acidiphilium sp. AL]
MSHISVTVFCGSSVGAEPDYMAAARALGKGLAARGMGLVFGGGNVGLMGELAGAALGAGAHVTGIIPEFLRAREVEFPGLSELIVTDSMHTRKRRMFARADAFVVLPGGLGTLDELIEIITWKQLGRHDKPIILVDILGWAQPVAALLDHVIAAGFARPSARGLIEMVKDVPVALARLEALADYSEPESSVGISAVGSR